MSEALRADGVSKTWAPDGPAPVRAVCDVSLAVAPGETVVVTGPSGSGKTTFLSLLGALVRPDRGRVVLDGIDLTAASDAALDHARLTRIGFVFQRGLLLRALTVRQNVALVPRLAGRSRADATRIADVLLERLGLASRAGVAPDVLSAGEAQRVALARAVALRPRVVLADEPTAHLDSATGATVVAALRALASEEGAALVVVTHDERLATLGDRRLRLEDGALS